jgi:hypothetical protein
MEKQFHSLTLEEDDDHSSVASVPQEIFHDEQVVRAGDIVKALQEACFWLKEVFKQQKNKDKYTYTIHFSLRREPREQ